MTPNHLFFKGKMRSKRGGHGRRINACVLGKMVYNDDAYNLLRA